MSCSHEHAEHAGQGGDEEPADESELATLYSQIDVDHVTCLNEKEPQSGRRCFKPHQERFDRTRFVENEDDTEPQLIFHVPFTSMVRIRSIAVLGGPGWAAPSEMRVHVQHHDHDQFCAKDESRPDQIRWINRDDVDFDTVEDMEPVQTWELAPPADDQFGSTPSQLCFYATRLTKFSQVRTVQLYFPRNFAPASAADDPQPLRIHYIGFRGDWQPLVADPRVPVYEVNANPLDHEPLATANTLQPSM